MEEFTVFFSFQTDSPEKTNFHFLRDLIKEVCESIKHYKVHFDYGFYNSSGNRPLTEHMLSRAALADIFIGDVTYTSEFNSHVYKKHWLLKKYSKINHEGRTKKYPNANVMIETGFSWALKNYERTILLFNNAYGNLDNDLLPADMLHIDRPKTYFLNESILKDKGEVEKISNTLKGTIKNEILKVIDHERDYLSKAFTPIYLLSKSPISHGKTPYILTEELIKSILNFRKILETPGSQAFLEGGIKYGKARFAFELFRKQNSQIKAHKCFLKSYYHNFQHGPISSIHEAMQKMAMRKQHFVLILDNCRDNEVNAVEEITKGTMLSVFYLKTNNYERGNLGQE